VESSSDLVLGRVAEVVVAVVAASTQSLHRPAQISVSPLAHTGHAAAGRAKKARRTTGMASAIKF
jgi:hypothetical protein